MPLLIPGISHHATVNVHAGLRPVYPTKILNWRDREMIRRCGTQIPVPQSRPGALNMKINLRLKSWQSRDDDRGAQREETDPKYFKGVGCAVCASVESEFGILQCPAPDHCPRHNNKQTKALRP